MIRRRDVRVLPAATALLVAVDLGRSRWSSSSCLDSRPRVARRGLVACGGLERLDAHVALGDRPLVGLLGQERADQADDRLAVREDADDVGAPADLLEGYSKGSVWSRLVNACGLSM